MLLRIYEFKINIYYYLAYFYISMALFAFCNFSEALKGIFVFLSYFR